MPTSHSLLRQVRRALVAVFVLGSFINVLLLAVPLYALHLFDNVAVAGGSVEMLLLLTLLAGTAVLTLVCLEAARDRILLRAGLWLDHTFGAHMLENGIRLGLTPVELRQNAEALALYRNALVERTLVPVLDALWAPLPLLALALLSPVLGGVAAICSLMLVLAILLQTRRTRRARQQAEQAAGRINAWWLGQLAHPPGLSPIAPEHWERINRGNVASAYALGRRTSAHHGFVRLVGAGSQLAVTAVGAWLVIAGHALTPAALFVAILIYMRLSAPLEAVAISLGTLQRVRAAYRLLEALPVAAVQPRASLSGATRSESPAPQLASDMPQLFLRGPLAFAAAVIVLFFAVGLGAAAHTPLDRIAGFMRVSALESQRLPVRHAKGGVGARIHVAEGADVKAGDLLVSLDTSAVDRQIAQLKSRAQSAGRQLAAVEQQTAELVGLRDPAPADKLTLLALEQHVIQLKMEAEQLVARIAGAEQELARSEIRAPVSGRVVDIAVSDANPVIAPGDRVLTIATAEQRSLLEHLIDPMLRNAYHAWKG